MKIISRNMLLRFAVLIFLLVCVVSLVVLRLDNNEKRSQVDLLRVEVENMQNYITELEADIAKPFDDEYVADIAHRELGLRYPQEVIFYSDSEG